MEPGGSYYAATATPREPAAALAGDVSADVCVIGGGFTGLSAALRLAEHGARVVLLEAKTIGAGASGVNGGQMIPGFRHGAVDLVRRFGSGTARALIDLTVAARDRMAARVARDGIACDLRLTGHLSAASFPSDIADFAAEAAALDALGIGGVTVLDARGVGAHVASDAYFGGLHDTSGGHVHPLNYAIGLASAAQAAGVTIYEASAATGIAAGAAPIVTTAAGRVRAGQVVVACDALIDGLAFGTRRLSKRLMPVWSYTIATAPLGEARAAALLPTNAAVSDSKFALDYYRRSADHRLLFSGGERYTLAPLEDIAGFVRPHLARAFPALATVTIDHAWAGIVAVTTSRFPHVGRDGAVWWAHGYSGHGVLLAQASGHAVGDAIRGDTAAFDLLSRLPSRDWPGGAALRQPLYTAGMAYYAARDRLRRAPASVARATV